MYQGVLAAPPGHLLMEKAFGDMMGVPLRNLTLWRDLPTALLKKRIKESVILGGEADVRKDAGGDVKGQVPDNPVITGMMPAEVFEWVLPVHMPVQLGALAVAPTPPTPLADKSSSDKSSSVDKEPNSTHSTAAPVVYLFEERCQKHRDELCFELDANGWCCFVEDVMKNVPPAERRRVFRTRYADYPWGRKPEPAAVG